MDFPHQAAVSVLHPDKVFGRADLTICDYRSLEARNREPAYKAADKGYCVKSRKESLLFDFRTCHQGTYTHTKWKLVSLLHVLQSGLWCEERSFVFAH
jgi:hypothetical protein